MAPGKSNNDSDWFQSSYVKISRKYFSFQMWRWIVFSKCNYRKYISNKTILFSTFYLRKKSLFLFSCWVLDKIPNSWVFVFTNKLFNCVVCTKLVLSFLTYLVLSFLYILGAGSVLVGFCFVFAFFSQNIILTCWYIFHYVGHWITCMFA